MAERENPDLVVLDMMMPKRSGFLVLERLRRSRPVPMRVIMITANEGGRHKAYAEMLGVADYLRKPFPMEVLLESVRRIFATKDGTEEKAAPLKKAVRKRAVKSETDDED